MRAIVALLVVAAVIAAPGAALAQHCADGRSSDAAMWYSIAHPGLGEYYLNGWGSFNQNCPQKKFWLGFIPLYGWPGYLQVKSAIDAKHCRTNDDLTRRE